MRWPWRRETRASGGYTEALIAAQAAAAAGTGADAIATAAVEAAAGMYARAFASAKVTPERLAGVLNPPLLADAVRQLIRRGESLHAIEIERGRLRLRTAAAWDVTGSPDPARWRYRLDLFGPSGSETRTGVSAAAVVHWRFASQPERSWQGIPPLGWAAVTGRGLGNLEAALADEAGTPHGNLLAVPAAGDDAKLNALRERVRTLAGRALLVETTAAGWGDAANAPAADWRAVRLGADPPAALVNLRSDLARAVMTACGVPVDLVEAGQGTAAREAWRRFYHGAVLPLARIVETEAAAKLDAPVRLSFEALAAADVAGRARAYASLVSAGYEAKAAAAVAGLDTGGAIADADGGGAGAPESP